MLYVPLPRVDSYLKLLTFLRMSKLESLWSGRWQWLIDSETFSLSVHKKKRQWIPLRHFIKVWLPRVLLSIELSMNLRLRVNVYLELLLLFGELFYYYFFRVGHKRNLLLQYCENGITLYVLGIEFFFPEDFSPLTTFAADVKDVKNSFFFVFSILIPSVNIVLISHWIRFFFHFNLYIILVFPLSLSYFIIILTEKIYLTDL